MRHPIRAELAVMSNVGLLKARPWYLMLAEEEAVAGQNGCPRYAVGMSAS
jgi:hypothetical protein